MASLNSSLTLSLSIDYCLSTSLYIMPAFTLLWTFFFFPVYFLVLWIGFRRWRQNKNSAVSYTDFFTYHMFVFELLLYCGYAVFSYGTLRSDFQLKKYGMDIFMFPSPGLLSLHALTCVERYLAVVHPVVYMTLKKRLWIGARRLLIFAIWVFCICWFFMLRSLQFEGTYIPVFTLLGTMTIVVTFCSIRVLCALRNPSPGERQGISQSKRRAFYTILTILSILLLWLAGELVSFIFGKTHAIGADLVCKLFMSGCWFEFPTRLVLPLLFLHRAGKLTRCGNK